MSQIGKTPDEKFLIKLFEIAISRGDPFAVIPIHKVAEKAGQKESEVKNITKLLAQANFIKKVGEKEVRLTEHGKRFVENEL